MRLNLEMTDEQVKSLRCLEKRTGAGSMKELVNHALSLLEWAADETARGNEIAAVNEENSVYRVVVTPYLQYVAKKERPEAERRSVPVPLGAD